MKRILATLLISFTITSCHKKNTEFDYSQAVETVHDYVEAQQMTNLLLATYFKAISDSTLITDSISFFDGAKVTLTSNPAKIEFKYSNDTIYDGFGHIRIGIYTATTSTNFNLPLAKITFDFPNFTYDRDKIVADNFNLTNASSNLVFDINADNIIRSYADTSGIISFNFDQSITLIKDPLSAYHTDNDQLEISGNLAGIARNGKSFSTITQESDNLLVYYTCNWMIAGGASVDLPEFIYNATVSYSNNGTCINKYSVLTNETLFEKTYDAKF